MNRLGIGLSLVKRNGVNFPASAAGSVMDAAGFAPLSLDCENTLANQYNDPRQVFYRNDLANKVMTAESFDRISLSCELTLAEQIF